MIVMCTLNSPYHCILLSHLLQTFAISSILTLLYLSCFFTLSKKLPTEIPETKLSSALINDDDPEIMSPLTPHLSKTETWASCTQSLSVSSDLLSHNLSLWMPCHGCCHPSDNVWCHPWCHAVNKSDSDTIIMVIVLVAGVGAVFILFALMALCYR